MPRRFYSQVMIEQAVRECRGMVYVAAKRLGCSPNTLKARLAKSPALQKVAEESKGWLLDQAELRLAEAVLAGEPWAIKFFLQTQARDRGYSVRTEIVGTGAGQRSADLNDDEQRAERLARVVELLERFS